MELQVTVTLSDRLFLLLEDKLPNLGRRVERAITKEIGAQIRRESSTEVKVATAVTTPPFANETVVEDISGEVPSLDAEPEVALVPEDSKLGNTSAPAPEPAPAKESEAIDLKKLPERIRAIMHEARQRIEGENYKDNSGSEVYKKYHRAMSDQFKQIAISLGYEKPSLIDKPEMVVRFKEECDRLIIDDNGKLTLAPTPF